MNDPSAVAIGHDLYMRAWHDPKRPPEYTVAQWVQALLEAALPQVKEDKP